MNETFEQCRKNLLRRGFEVRIAATTEEARQILREEIRAAAPETICFGGGGPNFFPQNLPGLFGRCGDPGFESAPDEIPAAAFQCFVHGGVI